MKPTADDLHHRHAHHPPTGPAVALHEEIRERGIEFAVWLNEHLPESRELSLALTAVQETTMWANAAVAIHVSGRNQPPQPTHGQTTLFTCPNCQERVAKRPSGHVNPHWMTEGYEKNAFSCQKKEQS